MAAQIFAEFERMESFWADLENQVQKTLALIKQKRGQYDPHIVKCYNERFVIIGNLKEQLGLIIDKLAEEISPSVRLASSAYESPNPPQSTLPKIEKKTPWFDKYVTVNTAIGWVMKGVTAVIVLAAVSGIFFMIKGAWSESKHIKGLRQSISALRDHKDSVSVMSNELPEIKRYCMLLNELEENLEMEIHLMNDRHFREITIYNY